MKIRHDRESGAIYIELREGVPHHSEDFSEKADVYLDVNFEGRVIGLEALSFEDLAEAIEERGGEVEIPTMSETFPANELIIEKAILRQAIDELSETEKRLVQLRFIEGWSLREIAEELSEPEAVVGQKIRVSLLKIKTKLSKARGYEMINEATVEAALTMA
ncbi:sigma factor-like helix-turn-helix DNA-binding protein [Rubrobacter indicoceani]|uniref:sigma factor-like helix-turn-helix DNA-binding protein n=1 Tax=Rubrobacter indicoceani TaxID=2051957 RepID=UPI000E5A710F|nr:sigma factor-like helix-turn-helix DNA-binding protein [Rubrobacter indicoceani]